MHRIHEDQWGPKHNKMPNLVSKYQEPNSELFEVFISPDNPPNQRRVFGYLRSADTETRKIYFKVAIQMVTSDKLNLATKKKVLESLAAFLSFSEESILEYAPPSLSIRDAAYDETLDSLADYLENEDILQDECREVINCLIQMDYFRVKRTLMLSYVEYTYPHDTDWYAKRLQLCAAALEKGDDFVAWNVLAFLSPLNGYKELESVLSDSNIEKQKITLLNDLLYTLDTVVPRWLLSSDYRVVSFACIYCNTRRLIDTLPLLEQIKNSENKLVKELVVATIRKFREK